MTSMMSMWIALVVLGPAPEQGPGQPDVKDFPQLACYRSTASEFIKEEKERLFAGKTDYTNEPWNSYDLEKVGELLFEKLYYIIRILLNQDENLSLVTRKDPFGILLRRK